ncbi:hypothetical protein Tco_1223738 [Tanacetum coccineum]
MNLYNLCTDFIRFVDMALPPRDQRHYYLRFEGMGYTNDDIMDFEERLEMLRDRVYLLAELGGGYLRFEASGALQFQLGGVRRRMSWREFILGMCLHTSKVIESVGFDAYRVESARHIPDNGVMSAYWAVP